MIKVEVWSDINCPFCYIGKKNLERALEKFPRAESVEVEWKSFELDPDANPPKDADNVDLIAKKYGRDRSWVESMNERIGDMGKEAGIDFHFEKVKPANSFKAHKLLHLAKHYGIQNEMKEALLFAKFTQGQDIADVETLVKIASSLKLDEKETREVLDGERYDRDVRKDEELAARMGIRGVPFFVVNGSEALSGAQPPEAFIEVLEGMN
jgi:predicted DsbA family dithiol-disulfide isomerase